MAEKGIAMYYVFQIVDVIAFVMMFFMLAVIINQQPSRAQLAFILYDVGTIRVCCRDPSGADPC